MDGYFGGGASQFAGAGFMPSPAPATDNQYGAGGGNFRKSGGGNRNETIRAVTIRQLVGANSADDGSSLDEVMLDGMPLTNVTIVGKIIDVQESSTKVTYKVTDGTGSLDVMMHQEEDEAAMGRRRELQPEVYVRAHGTLRRNNGLLGMTAYKLAAVTDFNEVSYHALQVIFQHLHLVRGPPTGGQSALAGAPAGHTTPGGTASGAPGYAGAAQGGPPAYGAGVAGPVRTGDPNQDVLQVFKLPAHKNLQHGLAAAGVQSSLAQQGIHYTLDQIRMSIDFLSNEGHLYSTIDDHFKCAEA